MRTNQESGLPTQTWKFWVILFLAYAVIVVLTMLKDLWLTGEKPNILFYVFVPISSILGGVLSMLGVAKIAKQTITFSTLLAISVGANTFMQVVENILKITYYQVWEYPGILYMLFVIPLGFLLMAYGLVRWGKVSRRMAMLLVVFDFVGSVAIGILLTDMIGLTTPGS